MGQMDFASYNFVRSCTISSDYMVHLAIMEAFVLMEMRSVDMPYVSSILPAPDEVHASLLKKETKSAERGLHHILPSETNCPHQEDTPRANSNQPSSCTACRIC